MHGFGNNCLLLNMIADRGESIHVRKCDIYASILHFPLHMETKNRTAPDVRLFDQTA